MPTPSTFPTQVSDLHFSDTTTNPTLYHTLKHLKKSTLSLHNRLLSILTDANYITTNLSPLFPSLPLIANERCGSWYIPPASKSGSAYFKSTDGHYGYWDFSLRRLNLQVLGMVGRSGGAVLVDSTRRGKRMPDALRRTVPVWVVVWNRVLFGGDPGVGEWALGLQHPGLEPGEVRLIEAKIDGWVDGLRGLGLDLEELKKNLKRPMRLCWVVHGEDVELPDFDEECEGLRRDDCNLLVLCSASRPVPGAEMSEDGYVQGAADDAEGWSGGLMSAMFWEYQDELMATPEEDLPGLIARLIVKSRAVNGEMAAVQIKPTENIFVAAAPTEAISDASRPRGFSLIIDCHGKGLTETSTTFHLGCRAGKLGSRDLREKLSLAVARVSEVLKNDSQSKILIVCETGKDLSIGVITTLLCLLYNEEGQLASSQSSPVNKQLVKKRLAWITSVKPDANPSRSTLQAVNTFLM